MPGGRDQYFMLDITEDADGPSLHVSTPASVLQVHDADELQKFLELYEDPVTNKVIKNTAKERRHYVEKILPALRWYCDKLDVEQPEWLVGNNTWEEMDDETLERLFGPEPLKFREFLPVNCPDIQVQREEPEPGMEEQQ